MNNQTILFLGVGAFLLLRQRAKNQNTLAALDTPKKHRAFSDLPAQEVNGQWMKYQNGTWLKLTPKEKVLTVNGRHVVRRWGSKPK